MTTEQLDFKRLKKKFLEQYSEETAINIKHVIFNEIVKELEERFNKDVSHFNGEEIKVLLPKFKSSSEQALASRVSILNRYAHFAVANGYLQNENNFYELIDYNMLKNYLNTFAIENKYLDDEDYEYLFKICKNDQDKALFLLLKEGVKGELMAEIANLKYTDIDFINNTLTLEDKDGSKRTIKVEKNTVDTLKFAYNETDYYVYVPEGSGMKSDSRPIYKSSYIMQKTSKRGNENMAYTGLRDRIKGISEFVGNPFLTPTNLWWSGIFWYARKLKAERVELTDVEYQEIIEKYNVPTSRGYKDKMVSLIKENL